jgi:hypothetical protein
MSRQNCNFIARAFFASWKRPAPTVGRVPQPPARRISGANSPGQRTATHFSPKGLSWHGPICAGSGIGTRRGMGPTHSPRHAALSRASSPLASSPQLRFRRSRHGTFVALPRTDHGRRVVA